MSAEKILVVEDERSLQALLKSNLETNGFPNVQLASNGENGLVLAEKTLPDLILLDLDLSFPSLDGLTVCRELKKIPATADIPLVVLSAKSADSDVVLGLELGANDYVVKPFGWTVLLARIRVQLRRRSDENRRTTLRCGALVLNIPERTVRVGDEAIELTFSEFEILRLFLARPGRVYRRWEIVAAFKGDDADVADRAVDVQLVNLRRKLGDFGARIETVRGVGYRLKQS